MNLKQFKDVESGAGGVEDEGHRTIIPEGMRPSLMPLMYMYKLIVWSQAVSNKRSVFVKIHSNSPVLTPCLILVKEIQQEHSRTAPVFFITNDELFVVDMVSRHESSNK